jgi:hypothetical protein
MNIAAIKYCKAVAKKASDEGWKLQILPIGFVWQKGTDQHGIACRADVKDIFHSACMFIEENQKWVIEVNLD